eukprot:GEMP01086200.1.p1 GENE.GEMP01086200.1~~GEMP01086200.1.p1  ORF type:complete len:119 (+),score=23.73 GEMP01086200.1:117-473(+)
MRWGTALATTGAVAFGLGAVAYRWHRKKRRAQTESLSELDQGLQALGMLPRSSRIDDDDAGRQCNHGQAPPHDLDADDVFTVARVSEEEEKRRYFMEEDDPFSAPLDSGFYRKPVAYE